MDLWSNGWTDERMDGLPAGRTDRWEDGQTDIGTYIRTNKLKIYSHRFLHGRTDRRADRWADGQLDRRNRWTDRRTGGQTADRWTEGWAGMPFKQLFGEKQ